LLLLKTFVAQNGSLCADVWLLSHSAPPTTAVDELVSIN